jgi:hypothetical protein
LTGWKNLRLYTAKAVWSKNARVIQLGTIELVIGSRPSDVHVLFYRHIPSSRNF